MTPCSSLASVKSRLFTYPVQRKIPRHHRDTGHVTPWQSSIRKFFVHLRDITGSHRDKRDFFSRPESAERNLLLCRRTKKPVRIYGTVYVSLLTRATLLIGK